MLWKKINDETKIEDIGAWLLANLAKGIYSQEGVLREYVQNACDAYKEWEEHIGNPLSNAVVKITIDDSNTISIQDQGIGMNLKAIQEAKKIAVSPKSGANLTGFRGIGIWAGFQACDTLEIVSTRKGDKNRYRLVIDFKDILKHVNDDIDIKKLLDNRYHISSDGAPIDEHYTRVTLKGLQPEYAKLADENELKRIVSQNLPCRLNPKYKFVKELEEFLHKVSSYHEYQIHVGKDEVFKDITEDVEPPKFETLKHNGTELARVWWCSGWGALKTDNFQHRSFRLRVRNFAVGPVGIYDDENGSSLGIQNQLSLKTRGRLNWHVGEIHITKTEIVPDTPRERLEIDQLSRKAIEEIRRFYGERIAEAGARSDFNSYRTEIESCEKKLSNNTVDDQGAADFLAKLKAQEKVLVGKPSTNPVKAQLRELLSTKDIRDRRKKLIKKLETDFKPPKKTKDKQKGAEPSGTQSGDKTSGDATKSGVQGNNVLSTDFEALLSEIIDLLSAKLNDDELVADLASDVQELFTMHQLIDLK